MQLLGVTKRTVTILLLVGLTMLGVVLASRIALAAPNVSISRLQCDAPGYDHAPGALNSEYVVFRNNTNAPVPMSGWTVQDKGANFTYLFRNYTLGAGKSVTLHTGRGTNSRTHLYWGRPSAVWTNTGDTATLRNRVAQVISRRSC